MGIYGKVGRTFIPAGLALSVTVALAQGPGHPQRNPRMGKAGNQAKVAQRAGQQQRAEQRAQRRADVQQDRARMADQAKPSSQDQQQRNKTAPEQQRPQTRPAQAAGAQVRPAQDRQEDLRVRLLNRIGLNPEQQERMARIRTVHDDELVSTGRRIRQAQRGLDEAMMNPQYNEAEVNRRIEDLAQAHADRVRLQQRMRAEIRQVLTPEQIMKFNQLQREMQQRQQEMKRIEMQQTSPDKSPSGDRNQGGQSRNSPQPNLDILDLLIASSR